MEEISKESLQRLPSYLRYLKQLHESNVTHVSSTNIAERLYLNPVSVRKELAFVSVAGGKPKTGFKVVELIKEISSFLGYNNVKDAVIVGVGKLGSALIGYKGFDAYGLKIVACFDNNKAIQSTQSSDKPVFDIHKMPDLVNRLNVKIGIITVPSNSAQEVCDLMIESGIKAIWNFSPTQLVTPSNIAVKNEDMAASLAVLSKQLDKILENE